MVRFFFSFIFRADVRPGGSGSTKAPEGEGCPRCGFAVYAAEQMISKGKVNTIPYLLHSTHLEHAIH